MRRERGDQCPGMGTYFGSKIILRKGNEDQGTREIHKNMIARFLLGKIIEK